MYRSLEYIIIMSCMSLHHERRTVNMLGEQHKCLCHFKQRKKRKEMIPYQALTIWLRATADDCGALNRL